MSMAVGVKRQSTAAVEPAKKKPRFDKASGKPGGSFAPKSKSSYNQEALAIAATRSMYNFIITL